MKRINRKTERRIHICLPRTGLIIGMCIILFFAIALLFPNWQKLTVKDFNNIDIFINNQSLNKERQTVKLIIDEKQIVRLDSFIFENVEPKHILGIGKHIVEVSTLDGKYAIRDTIEVLKELTEYDLWINYEYRPPIEEYKQIVLESMIFKFTYDKNYTKQQQEELRKQLASRIETEFRNGVDYKPTERYFEIRFEEQEMIPID